MKKQVLCSNSIPKENTRQEIQQLHTSSDQWGSHGLKHYGCNGGMGKELSDAHTTAYLLDSDAHAHTSKKKESIVVSLCAAVKFAPSRWTGTASSDGRSGLEWVSL